jgi:hypothetical protein
MRTDPEMRVALREWVLRKASDLDAGMLTDQTALFEQRFLRSLHVPELLLLLEGLRGKPIDLDELEPAHFRDIDTLVKQFGARA